MTLKTVTPWASALLHHGQRFKVSRVLATERYLLVLVSGGVLIWAPLPYLLNKILDRIPYRTCTYLECDHPRKVGKSNKGSRPRNICDFNNFCKKYEQNSTNIFKICRRFKEKCVEGYAIIQLHFGGPLECEGPWTHATRLPCAHWRIFNLQVPVAKGLKT